MKYEYLVIDTTKEDQLPVLLNEKAASGWIHYDTVVQTDFFESIIPGKVNARVKYKLFFKRPKFNHNESIRR